MGEMPIATLWTTIYSQKFGNAVFELLLHYLSGVMLPI